MKKIENTYSPENGTEEDGEQYKCRVPVVLVVDRVDSEKHKDDRLGTAAQHLHRVLDGCVRLGGNVTFDVVFHRYSTKRDAVTNKKKREEKLDLVKFRLVKDEAIKQRTLKCQTCGKFQH